MGVSEKTNQSREINYLQATRNLLAEQINEWQLCGKNYSSLQSVKTRDFTILGNRITIQFNPGRMTSTSAKVDTKSILERKCFLCKENRPPEQRGISFVDDYTILVNPFPIFPEHFTIVKNQHSPQEIKSVFHDLLDLSMSIGERYLVFYNGPRCGASAPDHLHFQAGNRGFLPIESEYSSAKKNEAVITHENNSLYIVDDGLRKYVLLSGDSTNGLTSLFNKLYSALEQIKGYGEEPMMNLIAYYSAGSNIWDVIIFLREKHRPTVYFAEGENQILLSPAAVDIAGVCVTPREEDFNKVTDYNLKEIFHEVFISDEQLTGLKEQIKQQ